MTKGQAVEFRDSKGRWRPGTIHHVNAGNSLIVQADDEEMKYSVDDADVRKRAKP